MSVAAHLGLDGPEKRMDAAERCWPAWAEQDPRLEAAPNFAGLRGWLRSVDPAGADAVLHALATLGARSGGDSPLAASVLAWALLPGACSLARQLVTLTPRIDEMVAAQLWIEVRTFPWERRSKVAANVLASTRTGVLRECGVRSQVERMDRTWSRSVPADPHGVVLHAGAATAGEPPSPAEELLELLGAACASGTIGHAEMRLLLMLADAADRIGPRRTGRGCGGLMANDVCADVASRLGISAVTVRRRTRRSLRALTEACAAGRFAA